LATGLGLITIGHSPRPDLEAEFRKYAPHAEIRLLGALDGLQPGDLSRLTREIGPYPLLVRLSDGRTAEIPLRKLLPLVQRQAHELVRLGAGLLVLLCAGGFPELDSPVPVVLPGRVMPAVAGSLSRSRRVGIVTPNEGQVEAARTKWAADGFHAAVTYASPVRLEEIERAAREMADPRLDLVVLDCMGHNPAYRQEFARRCGRPVLLTQSVVAKLTGELL